MSVELETPSPEAPATPAESQPRLAATEPRRAEKPFDFRHPVFLSSAQWRKIRAEVEEFAEAAAALLSTYLRLEFSVQVAKLTTASFSEFNASLAPSTHLTLFKLEPLRGISVLEIRPSIGLGIVDRLLGGPGQPATLDRDLTEMEVALADQLVLLFLGEWCSQWKRFQDLRPEIAGHESNPRFLQSSTGDTVMLVVTLEVRMGECTGQFQLAVPYYGFEPILNELTESSGEPAAAAPAPVAAPKWNRNLDLIPIQLKAQCPAFKIAARDLFKLKVGEVLQLQPQSAEKIELRVGLTTKFRGRLGTHENRWAVQITEILQQL